MVLMAEAASTPLSLRLVRPACRIGFLGGGTKQRRQRRRYQLQESHTHGSALAQPVRELMNVLPARS